MSHHMARGGGDRLSTWPQPSSPGLAEVPGRGPDNEKQLFMQIQGDPNVGPAFTIPAQVWRMNDLKFKDSPGKLPGFSPW